MKKNKTAVIIGFGASGRRHAKILKTLKVFDKIYVVTKQKNIGYEKTTITELIKINPDYFVICSETYKHIHHLKFINDNFSKKKILVEKPIFEKFYNFKSKNNKIYVAYNFRFHPIINFLKNYCKNKKIWFAHASCTSYLPKWRKNISYKNSYSSNKNKGGGVLLDLSHEFDFLTWVLGKLKFNYSYYNKISNLKIKSKDFLFFSGSSHKSKIIQITLNYFSKISKRCIFLEGKNFYIYADLLKNFIKINIGNKSKIIRYSKNSLKNSYIDEHKKILLNQTKNLCKYKEALDLNKLFDQIIEKDKKLKY